MRTREFQQLPFSSFPLFPPPLQWMQDATSEVVRDPRGSASPLPSYDAKREMSARNRGRRLFPLFSPSLKRRGRKRILLSFSPPPFSFFFSAERMKKERLGFASFFLPSFEQASRSGIVSSSTSPSFLSFFFLPLSLLSVRRKTQAEKPPRPLFFFLSPASPRQTDYRN